MKGSDPPRSVNETSKLLNIVRIKMKVCGWKSENVFKSGKAGKL